MGARVTWVAALLASGCALDLSGSSCPEAKPNGRQGVLYFDPMGYLADGLHRTVLIPSALPAHDFTLDGTALVFDPPVCEVDEQGFPVLDKDGVPQCHENVHTEPTSKTCSYADVTYNFSGVTVQTTSKGSVSVLSSEVADDGVHLDLLCTAMDSASGDVDVTIRDKGGVRYRDTIWQTCLRPSALSLYVDEIVGRVRPTEIDVQIHVGEEFYMTYTFTATSLGVETDVLSGQGMVAADPDPPFTIIGYDRTYRRVHMRALKPAIHPVLVAGSISQQLPATIVP